MFLWNFTIDDTSPAIKYTPPVDGAPSNGWQTWYTQSAYNTSISQGTSYHVTSSSGSKLTLNFYGTGVGVYGLSTAPYDVTVDDTRHPTFSSNSSTAPLFSTTDLLEGEHQVTIAPKPTNGSQQFRFDFAQLSTPLTTDENPLLPIDLQANSSRIRRDGNWQLSDSGLETRDENASLSLEFSQTRAISVKGPVGPDSGRFSISITGNDTSHNASSIRSLPDVLLYFHAGLDPKRSYTLTVSNVDPGKLLSVKSILLFEQQLKNAQTTSMNNGIPVKRLNPALIYGPVLGVFLALLLVITLWRYCRERRDKLKYFREQMPSKMQLTFRPMRSGVPTHEYMQAGGNKGMAQRDYQPGQDRPSELLTTSGHMDGSSRSNSSLTNLRHGGRSDGYTKLPPLTTPPPTSPLPEIPAQTIFPPSSSAVSLPPASTQAVPSTLPVNLPVVAISEAIPTVESGPSIVSTSASPLPQPPFDSLTPSIPTLTAVTSPRSRPLPASPSLSGLSAASVGSLGTRITTITTKSGPVRRLPVPPGFSPQVLQQYQEERRQAGQSTGTVLPMYQP